MNKFVISTTKDNVVVNSNDQSIIYIFENVKGYEEEIYDLFLDNKKVEYGEIYKYWESSQKKLASNKKVKFLKTHNALIAAYGKQFTSSKYSLGAIYIVRDPRNVLTSIKNHYDFKDYNSALNFMMDDNKYVWGFDNNYSKSQIITSWKINYLSWIEKNERLKTILIKYEDLIEDPKKPFEKISPKSKPQIINFGIDKVSNIIIFEGKIYL